MFVWWGGNFVPCHYHTNVCKISRLCKAISSLSLEVSSLNLVSYCKLPLLSPGLSAGTVITKETKKANSRVHLVALLFVCNVSFVVRNLSLVNYRRNLHGPITGGALVRGSLRHLISRPISSSVNGYALNALYQNLKTHKQKQNKRLPDVHHSRFISLPV